MAVTRDIFDSEKRYFGSRVHDGKIVYHWDLNATNDETRYKILEDCKASLGGDGVLVTDAMRTSGDLPLEKVSDQSNNVEFRGGGYVVVAGRVVELPTDDFFYYVAPSGNESLHKNYVVKGSGVSVVSEDDPGVLYTIEDTSKNFTDDYDLENCTIIFHDGLYEDDEFEIVSRVSATRLQLACDFSGGFPAATDNYTIVPKALTTPGVDTETDLTLVTWFEQIDEEEDADLADTANPTVALRDKATDRLQLRWCIYNDWQGTSGSDLLNDHIGIVVATLDRTGAQALIDDGEFIYKANQVLTNDSITENISDLVDDIASLQSNINANYDDIIDLIKFDNARRFGAPEFSQDDPLRFWVAGSDMGTSGFRARVTEYSTNSNPDLVAGSTDTFVASGESWVQVTKNSETLYVQELVDNPLDLNAGDLVVGTVYEDSGIARSYTMGYIPIRQGFDWGCYWNNTDWQFTVSPGQVIVSGRLVQLPYSITVDPENTSAHYDSVVPTSAWRNVYLTYDEGESPMFAVEFANVGLDASGQAFSLGDGSKWRFLLGYVWFDGNGEPASAFCRSGRIFMSQSNTFSFQPINLTYTSLSSTGITEFTLPKGISLAKFRISSRLQNGDCTMALFFKVDGIYEGLARSLVMDGNEDSVVEMPCGFGEDSVLGVNFEENNIHSGSVTILLEELVFDPVFTPDSVLWTI